MAKARYGRKSHNPIFRWVYIVIFAIVALWLLTSIITQKSPLDVLGSFFSKIPNTKIKDQERVLAEKDSIIADLEA